MLINELGLPVVIMPLVTEVQNYKIVKHCAHKEITFQEVVPFVHMETTLILINL